MKKNIVTKLAILLSIVVIAVVGFYHREKILQAYGLSRYVAQLKNWAAQLTSTIGSLFHKDKNKQVVVNKQKSPPSIHFEFYTTLPAMQVQVPVPQKIEEHGLTTEARDQAARAEGRFHPDEARSAIERHVSVPNGLAKNVVPFPRLDRGINRRAQYSASKKRGIFDADKIAHDFHIQMKLAQRKLQQKNIHGIVRDHIHERT